MRRIYFVTNGYPFTAEESPFIQPEIDYLVTKYEITLIACLTEGEYEDEGNDGEVKRLASKIPSHYMLLSTIYEPCYMAIYDNKCIW